MNSNNFDFPIKKNGKSQDLQLIHWDNTDLIHQFPLTQILENTDLQKLCRISPLSSFTPTQFEIKNPYPTWVDDLHLWSQIGTLTDYLVRKILLLHFSDKVNPNHKTIAAECNHILDKLASNGFHVPTYLDQRHKWVEIYNSSEDIVEIIDVVSKMVNLDMIFRSGCYFQEVICPIFPNREIPPFNLSISQIFQLIPFFNRISKFIHKKFAKVKTIYLNPTLGNPYTCKADADLILDKIILEIKTIKRPEEYIRDSYLQLLGYCAMQTWLQIYKNRYKEIDIHMYPSLDAPRIEYIGFVWTQQLEISIMSVKEWSDYQRILFLKQLLNSTNLVKNQKKIRH